MEIAFFTRNLDSNGISTSHNIKILWGLFPQELLLEIFSYLTPQEVFNLYFTLYVDQHQSKKSIQDEFDKFLKSVLFCYLEKLYQRHRITIEMALAVSPHEQEILIQMKKSNSKTPDPEQTKTAINYQARLDFLVSQGFCNWEKATIIATKNGHFRLARILYRKLTINKRLRCIKIMCMSEAIRIDHHELFEFFDVRDTEHYIHGLLTAIEINNRHFINYFLSFNVVYDDDWNELMITAAKNGQLDLVNLFIEKGATDWDRGLKAAARHGGQKLIDLFIEKGSEAWVLGLMGAARGDHLDLVERFIDRGARNWNEGMLSATRGGHQNIVEFLIERSANNWCRGLDVSSRHGHLHLVKFFIEEIPEQLDAINNAMTVAVLKNHCDIVNFLISRGANDYNGGLRTAASRGSWHLIELFIEKGADDWSGALFYATLSSGQEIIEFFKSRGGEIIVS